MGDVTVNVATVLCREGGGRPVRHTVATPAPGFGVAGFTLATPSLIAVMWVQTLMAHGVGRLLEVGHSGGCLLEVSPLWSCILISTAFLQSDMAQPTTGRRPFVLDASGRSRPGVFEDPGGAG